MKEEKNRGFSLVEVLVAVAILAIVVGPFLYSFVMAARVNSSSRSALTVSTAAQNVMERIQSRDVADLSFTDNGDGTYQREFTETVNGTSYRVLAYLDANRYKKASQSDPDQYNDMALAQIYGMDPKYDACYIQSADMDDEAADTFAPGGGAFPLMKRELTLHIQKNAEGQPEVLLDIGYEYNSRKIWKEEKTILYRNVEDHTALRNVYLFFQPMYTSAGGIRESLDIINDAQVPVTVYLVKQKNAKTNSGTESTYQAAVDVTEPLRSIPAGSAWNPVTRLRTNLSDVQMRLTYGGDTERTMNGRLYPAAELTGRQTLFGGETEDRIYEVKLEVYDGNGEKVTTLTGTKQK